MALDAGPPPRLTLTARPGDTARVFVGTGLRDTPAWSLRGAYRLDGSARPLSRDLVLSADGLAVEALPAGVSGSFLVQALVAPAGEAPGSGQGSRWTPVFQLSVGVPATATGESAGEPADEPAGEPPSGGGAR